MDDTFLSSSKSLFNCELIEYGFSGEYNYTGKFFEMENKLIINNNKKHDTYLCISNSYLTNQLAKNILCSYSVASELGISSKICKKRLNTFSLPEATGLLDLIGCILSFSLSTTILIAGL